MESQWYQQQLTAYGEERNYSDTSRYAAFKVVFHLASPVAGNDYLHLDALLQYCVVQGALQGRTLPPSPTTYAIPLPLEVVWTSSDVGSLYHSTSLFPDGPEKKRVSYWTKRNDAFSAQFARRKANGDIWSPDNGSGTYREYLTPLPLVLTRSLVGYGVGDMVEVERLLSTLSATGIGKKTSIGFGQVNALHIEPYVSEERYVFLRDGKLLRPVPRSALVALGYQARNETGALFMGYAPPYWLLSNQSVCYPERTEVIAQGSTQTPTTSPPRWSTADFLLYCERREAMFRASRGSPVDIVLRHLKLQEGKGQGALCAVSGHPIGNEGAVAVRDVLKGSMGHTVDYLKAPESPWVSHASALVMSQQRLFHRSFAALISPDGQQARLLWPTVAVDPTYPQQERPLWREVVLALADEYWGYRCLLLCKDEPKSRLWPRARQGIVGERTPFYLSDAELSISQLLYLDMREVKRQMVCIEVWLDAGYPRAAIRSGVLHATPERLQETLAIQRQLVIMRQTAEFLLAWRIARVQADRAKRKGSH